MKIMRIAAGLLAGALVVASCGGGSGSSDTTERTRNTATASPFANRVIFVSGLTDDGLTKIYQYSFNSLAVPTITELFSAPVGADVGVADISYASSNNTLFWAMQDGNDLKIMSLMPGSGGAPVTYYTIANAYPYSFTRGTNGSMVWSGATASTPQVWVGNDDGRAEKVLNSMSVASLVTPRNGSGSVYGAMGSGVVRFDLSSTRSPSLHNVGSSFGRPILLDSPGNLLYYVTEFSSGVNSVVRVTPRGTDSPVLVASASKRVMSMSMTSDGSLFWADGPRPSMGDPLTPSTITWVNPADPTDTQEYSPDSPLSITSIWVVEPPAQVADAAVYGEPYINSELYCVPGFESDLIDIRSSGNYVGWEVQWFRNGELIPDATIAQLEPTEPGRYKCTSNASNIAGYVTITTPEFEVIDPSATTTTIEPTGSGSGASSTTVAAAPAPVAYKSISVKWSYSSVAKVLTASFTKVSGARTYGMAVTGATKKSVKCTTSGTKVTCKVTLKKGKNSITINARNATKVIVAQKKASKTVR